MRRGLVSLLVALVGCVHTQATQPPAGPPTPVVSEAARPVAPTSMSPVPPSAAPPEAAVTPAPVGEPPWAQGDLPKIRAVAPLVERAAARHGLEVGLVDAIIWHESRFDPKARGPGGAAGLMQLMPTTSKGLAKRMGVAHRPYEAAFNVDAGALLLSRLLEIFDGDLDLALAGYALGHGTVKKRLAEGTPLPERTLRFVAKVRGWAPLFTGLHLDAGGESSGDGAAAGHAAP